MKSSTRHSSNAAHISINPGILEPLLLRSCNFAVGILLVAILGNIDVVFRPLPRRHASRKHLVDFFERASAGLADVEPDEEGGKYASARVDIADFESEAGATDCVVEIGKGECNCPRDDWKRGK